MAKVEDEGSMSPIGEDDMDHLLSLAHPDAPIEPLIQMFKDKGVFSQQSFCSYCNTAMEWKKDGRVNPKAEGYFWKCRNAQCEARYKNKSVRDGTIFSKARIDLKEWLMLMVHFANHGTALQLSKAIKLSRESITQWFKIFRGLISQYFDEHPIKLGGQGKICHIDESSFALKHKESHCTECPVLVIVDGSKTPVVGYMEIVDKTDSVTLQSIIKRICLPGTIIYSDDWEAYRSINENLGFDHKIVGHSDTCVDPHTLVHTKVVENYWNKHRIHLNRMRGVEHHNLKFHLQEAMFREHHSGDMLNALFDVIAYSNRQDSNERVEEGTKRQRLKLQNSIFIDQNCVTKGSNNEEEPNVKNKDNYSTEKQTEKQLKYMDPLDTKVKKNTDVLGEPPNKKHRPSSSCTSIIQQDAQYSNNIIEDTDGQEPEPGNETSILNIINFFQQYHLLNDEIKCDHCDGYMILKESSKEPCKMWQDGFFWKCENRSCSYFNRTSGKSIREGSIFARSKLLLSKWYDIMYLWSENVIAKPICEQVSIARQTRSDCYSFFREVCDVHFKANPIRIGGTRLSIETYKYGLEMWILCIVDSNCSHAVGYMEIVKTNIASALYPIIRKVVYPGSIIHSKDWRVYRKIQGLSEMEIVKHTVNFVDVDTSLHKQPIDSYWMKYKNYLKAMKGIKRNCINSYLQEFMWRERFSSNPLENLCKQIADQCHDVRHIETFTSDSAYVDNTEASYSGVEIGNHIKYLEVQLEENQGQELDTDSDNVMVPNSAITPKLINAIEWFQEHQLLKKEMNCIHCDAFMTWKEFAKKKTRIWPDGYIWKCENKSCSFSKHDRFKSIRTGSLFSKSKLSLINWYDIMLLWSKSSSIKTASDEISISAATIGSCYRFLREICEIYFIKNPIKLGGPEIAIEIDIYILSNENQRNKYGPWVFCMVETNCSLSIGYMEMIESRESATLLSIITKVVRPGSIILCKEWRDFRHLNAVALNNPYSFVDANTYAHSNRIESYWNKHKSTYQAMKGGKVCNISSYLQDFMWHERFPQNTFKILCQQIATQYLDASYIDNTNSSNLEEETEKEEQYSEEGSEKNMSFSEVEPSSPVEQGSNSVFQNRSQQINATDDSSCHSHHSIFQDSVT